MLKQVKLLTLLLFLTDIRDVPRVLALLKCRPKTRQKRQLRCLMEKILEDEILSLMRLDQEKNNQPAAGKQV